MHSEFMINLEPREIVSIVMLTAVLLLPNSQQFIGDAKSVAPAQGRAGTSENVDKRGYDLTQELMAGKHQHLASGIV